jgi:23S rRNA (cytosine1962-C5)-methyltransferase
MKSTKDMYDVIILDPPSLIRSKKQIKQAEHSYYALHRDAMLHLNKDGIIATATCSHHFTREMFVEVIRRAGANTLRRVQILEERGAASDHPILVSMPETEYFKMFILQIS